MANRHVLAIRVDRRCGHRAAGIGHGRHAGAIDERGKPAAELAHGPSRLRQFPPLAAREINRDTVKDLKLKFIFSIGGRSTGGTLPGKEESTPLVDDGFMYVSDTWSRVMKFDVRSGTEAVPLWRYDPKITKARTNRGHRDVRQQGLHLHQRRCA